MSLRNLCRDKVNIEENVGIADGAMGTPADWRPKYINVACRMAAPPRQALQRFSDQEWEGMPAIATHRIYIPEGSLRITEAMRVRRGAAIYRILSVRNWHHQNIYLMIDVEELR